MEASDLAPRGRALVVADIVVGLVLSLASTMGMVLYEGVSFARLATTVVSFPMAVQFPLGTAASVYWLVKVREREREAPAA